MLDLNLAKAAKRSFYARSEKELGVLGVRQHLGKCLRTYCMRPRDRAEARMVLPSQMREMTMRKSDWSRQGWQEECYRQNEKPGQRP